MVTAFIIGLIIALARTTYMAYDLYKKVNQLFLVNQDIINHYEEQHEKLYMLSEDNDALAKILAGKQERINLLIEDKQSLMNTIQILQGGKKK